MKQTVIIPSTHWRLSDTNNYEIQYPFTDLFFEPNKTYNVTLTVISSNVHSNDISDDAHDENLNNSILPATYKYHLNLNNFSIPSYLSSYLKTPTNSAISHYSVVDTKELLYGLLHLTSLLLRNCLLAFPDNFNKALQNSDSILFATHFAFNPENCDCYPLEAENITQIYQQNFTTEGGSSQLAGRQVMSNTKTYRSPRVSLLAFLAPRNQTNFFTALSSEFWRNYDSSPTTSASTYQSRVGGNGGLVIDFVNFYDTATLKVRPALEVMFGYWSASSQTQTDIRKTIWIDDTYATFLYTDGGLNGGSSLGGGSINSNSTASSVENRMSILSNYSTNNDDIIKKKDCYFSISARINNNSLHILLMSTNMTTAVRTVVVEDVTNLAEPFFYFCDPSNSNYNLYRYSVGFYPDTFSVSTLPMNSLRERLQISMASANHLISTSPIGDLDVRMLYPINIYKTMILRNINDTDIQNLTHNPFPPNLEQYETNLVLNFNMNPPGILNKPESIETRKIQLVFEYYAAPTNSFTDRAGLFMYDSNNDLIDFAGIILNCNKSDFTFVNIKPNIENITLDTNPNIFQNILLNNQNEIVFKSICQSSAQSEVLNFLQVNNLGYSNVFVTAPSNPIPTSGVQYAKLVAEFSFNSDINIASIQFKCNNPSGQKNTAFPQRFQLNYIPLGSSSTVFQSFIELNNLQARTHTSGNIGATSFSSITPVHYPDKFFPLNRFFKLNPTIGISYFVGNEVGSGVSAVKTLALNIANNAYSQNNSIKQVGIISRFFTQTSNGPYNNTKKLKYKFTTKNPENIEKLLASVVPNISNFNAFNDFPFPPNIILEFEPLEPTKRLSGRKRKNFLV